MTKTIPPKKTASQDLSKLFGDVPRPVRADWEKALSKLKPWLSPEKFAETEAIHWRMFERANRWHEQKPAPSKD